MRISDWSSDVCSSDLPLPAIAEACVFENPASRRKSSTSEREGRLPSCKLAFTPVTSERRFAGKFTTDTSQSPSFSSKKSEEGRVGKGCVSHCRLRWSPHIKKKTKSKE